MIISDISVRRPVFAVVVSLLLTVLGLMALARLPIREYPNVESPQVSVSINYRGASADVVETKITRAVENQLAGIEGLEKLESSSEDERSRVSLEFTVDTDIEAAANDVRDRISRIQSSLPDEADAPQISKVDSRSDNVMTVSLTSKTRSSGDLTDYANRYIVDRITVVSGVATVQLYGAQKYSMRVWLDRRALAARQLTVQDVESALRKENVELPAGRLESQQREFTLRTDTGMRTVDDFRQLVVGRGDNGYLVRLADVATVNIGPEDDRTISRKSGQPDVALAITPTSTANVLDVAIGVRKVVDNMQRDLPKDIVMTIAQDNSTYVSDSIHEVMVTLGIALLLVLVVIYAFLGTLRATLIPAVTIPVSIISACMVMSALGFSINVLTLLGAVLAIGLVVDDAIVVLENIVRRMEEGEPALIAAIDGSKEIGFAVIATTLALTAVFLPISYIPGNIGKLFGEFGISVAAAILFSALIALTLTPMLASVMFARGITRGRVTHVVDAGFSRLAAFYRRTLEGAVRHAWVVVVVAVVVSAVGYLMFRTLPSEYTPVDDRGMVIVNLTPPEGSSIQYVDRYLREVEKVANEEITNGVAMTTIVRAGANGGGNGGSGGRVMVRLVEWDQRSDTAQTVANRLRGKLASLPGVRINTQTPTGLGGRGGGQPVQFVLGGPSYEDLVKWRNIVLARAKENPGLLNPDSDYDERKPQLKIEIDRERAADLGVSLQSVGQTLETMLGARKVTTYVDRGEEYNVMLQASAEDRASPSDLENIYVRSEKSGSLVPLSNLVVLKEVAGPKQLNRFDRQRAIEISAGLADGYSLGQALSFLENVVRTELPPEATISYDGQSREFKKSSGALYSTFLLAIGIVYLVLAAQFESFRHPAIIITTVPLAIAGAVLGLWWQGSSINVFSQIGAVMLIGLAAKNGILIVEFANQLRDRGIEFAESIIEAATIRLRPVLMTSLCTVFGAMPLLLADGPGAESRRPIGAVIVFGVMLSLLLTLYVVPAVYMLVARNTRSPEYISHLVGKLRSSLSNSETAKAGEHGAP
ncbi:MAG: efflux RND transporter permease subunit [Steroidobacteraceae bacterium]